MDEVKNIIFLVIYEEKEEFVVDVVKKIILLVNYKEKEEFSVDEVKKIIFFFVIDLVFNLVVKVFIVFSKFRFF